MHTLASIPVVLVLAGVHLTIGKWHWLNRAEHSPWLSASAGTALAYVFAYLLPKLADTQEELTLTIFERWTPELHNHTYLIALAGLVCFFWLGWYEHHLEEIDAKPSRRSRRILFLHLGGFGIYSMQIGLLVANLPQPSFLTYGLATGVLALHIMGVDHGLRHSEPESYDKLLRWVLAGALAVGWSIGSVTEELDTLFMLLNAFIAGGIIITAIREELPSRHQGANFLPFLAGVICSSTAIVIVQLIASATD